jgi:hypothetical protein
MGKFVLGLGIFVLIATAAVAAEGKGIRFWNLTPNTIVELRMSSPGSDAWGSNQCANDRDGAVDHDERLRIVGIGPGRYDLKVAFKDGRICTVRNIEVKDGGIFSIEDKDLTDCAE